MTTVVNPKHPFDFNVVYLLALFLIYFFYYLIFNIQPSARFSHNVKHIFLQLICLNQGREKVHTLHLINVTQIFFNPCLQLIWHEKQKFTLLLGCLCFQAFSVNIVSQCVFFQRKQNPCILLFPFKVKVIGFYLTTLIFVYPYSEAENFNS